MQLKKVGLPGKSALAFLVVLSLLLVACGGRINNQNWPGLSADGQSVYVAYGPGVLAFDVPQQEWTWSYPAEAKANLLFFARPSIQDGQVIIGDYGASGGFLSPSVTVSVGALGQEDGQVIWSNNVAADDKIVAAPLQVGQRAYIGTADNYVLALDSATGVIEWSYETGHSVWGKPAYDDGVLFVSSMDRNAYALDAVTGEVLWHTELGGAIAGGPILNGDLVYVPSFDSQVHALERDTGVERWAAAAENWIWGTSYSDGRVYYADVDGNVFVVNAADGSAIWQAAVEGPVTASPVIVGDVVYVASAGDPDAETVLGLMSAFDVTDGHQLWQSRAPAPLVSTPVVVDDVIIAAMQDNSDLLIAFDLESGAEQWTAAPPAAE